MSFKIKGNDPLCEPPPLTSLLNETERVTERPIERAPSRTGRDAIERGGDSQDERDVAPTTPVSFAPACFDSIAEEAFAFAGTVTGSR